MRYLLPQPYCDFDPEEWEAATGVPPSQETSDDGDPASEDICPFRDDLLCPIHGPIGPKRKESPAEVANRLLSHFATTPSDGINEQQYYSISGLEIPGFDLCGRTLYAQQSKEIDLSHLISHGEFGIAKSAVANRLNIANSLFRGSIRADHSKFDEKLTINHSHVQKDVVLKNAEVQGGLEIKEAKIEGSLILKNATIYGDIDLDGSEIQGDLDLSKARVLGKVRMPDTEIGGECKFSEAQIESEIQAPDLDAEIISLDHATVGGHIIFRDFTGDELKFNSSHIHGSLNLISADIEESVSCLMMVVEGEIRIRSLNVNGDLTLKGCKCKHQTKLKELEVDGSLNLRDVDASHHLIVQKLEVQEDVNFCAAELASFTVFDQIVIKGKLLADTTNATGAIALRNLNIREDASLKDLSIDESLIFYNVRISGDCTLSHSRITERTSINETRIGGRIIARETQIDQRLVIFDSHVSQSIRLVEARLGVLRIDPNSVISGLNLRRSRITDQPLDISNVHFRGKIVLDEATIIRGVMLDEATVPSISMEECSIGESLTATNLRVGSPLAEGSIEADQLSTEGYVDFTDVNVSNDLQLTQATIGGDLTLDNSRIKGELRLSDSFFNGEFVAVNVHWGDVMMVGTTLGDDLLLLDATTTGGITSRKLTSDGDTINIINSNIQGGINFENADIEGSITISWSNLYNKTSKDEDTPVIQAKGITIRGELLLESDLIYGDVVVSKAAIEGRFRVTSRETDHSTIVSGEIDLTDAIVEQQLILSSIHVGHGVIGTDIRVGSKTILETVTGKQAKFDDAYFKWNVSLDSVYMGEIDFTDSNFANKFDFKHTVVSQTPLLLENARIHEAKLNRGFTGTIIDCTEAKIEELSVNGFDPNSIWDEIKIEKTRFDGFDFTDFTSSLHEVKYRIHHNRDARPLYLRFFGFLLTLFKRLMGGIGSGGKFIITRDLEDIANFREQHFNREITYRRAKDSADSTSDNTAASEFYRLEKKHRRRRRFWEIIGKEGRKSRNILNYLSNSLLGAVAGHGERISRVGYSAVGFILLFTALYSMATLPTSSSETGAVIANVQHFTNLNTFVNNLSLSVASFVNIPGSIPNEAPRSVRFISYVERLIGAAYIPLLVFTLTRSLHR